MQTLAPTKVLRELLRDIHAAESNLEMYVLPQDPYESYGEEEGIHLAIVADCSSSELNELFGPIAKAMEEANLKLDFEPFLIAHPTRRGTELANAAQKEGDRVQ